MKGNRSPRWWSVNAKRNNDRLTCYKEEEVIETMVRKCHEQEPRTHVLQRGTDAQDESQQMRQAGAINLLPTKGNKWPRRWSANAVSRNHILTTYEEG